MSRSAPSDGEVQSLVVAAGGNSAALVFHGIACGNCFKMPETEKVQTCQRLQDDPLQPCRKCRRVRFCNETCREHACTIGVHKQFCSVLAKIPARWKKTPIDTQGPKGWTLALKTDGPAVLTKCLKSWDNTDMAFDAMMFSRHCIVCNRTSAETKLRPCGVCLWDWSCEAHSDSGSRPAELKHTPEACLRYCDANAHARVELSWVTKASPQVCILDLNRASDASFPESSELTLLSSPLSAWDNFFEWRFGFVLADAGDRRSDCIEASFDASRPLTILHAANQLEIAKHDVLVHVIRACILDMRSSGAMWRLVLPYLRPRLHLRIVFIGPRFEPEVGKYDAEKHWPENDACCVSFVEASYQEYRAQTCFEKPDIAVAFNAGLHHYTEWPPALQVLMDLNIPVVITGRTSEEMDELNALKSVAAKVIQPPIENPFHSLVSKFRVGRTCLFESDNAFYILFKGREERETAQQANQPSVKRQKKSHP